LRVSPFREDGKTYVTPTWIWSVVVDGSLYARAYNGQKSRWYQTASSKRAGRIAAAGMTKDVSFDLIDGPIIERIDQAYQQTYRGSPYLESMIFARARASTVRIVPR
jgi:hypothetical protein